MKPHSQINRGPDPDLQSDDFASQTDFEKMIDRKMSALRAPGWLRLVHLILTIGLGSCMLFGALFLFSRTILFINRAIATTGTVIDHRVTTSSSSSSNRGGSTTTMSYHPVVQFQVPPGGNVQFVSKTGDSSPEDRPKGSKVPVLFNPNNPSNAEIHTGFDIWGGPVFLLIFGTIWTGAGVVTRRFL